MSLRVGLGVDAHAFADGVPLVLGGVTFDSPRGLAGHSDGDVVTHALIDAVLGAAGLGDIGSLFPSDGSTPLGVSSLELLRDAVAQVRERGLCGRECGLHPDRGAASNRRPSCGDGGGAERSRRRSGQRARDDDRRPRVHGSRRRARGTGGRARRTVVRLVRYADAPDLQAIRYEVLSQVTFPEYLQNNVPGNKYWGRLYDDFPDFQLALVDGDELVAELHSVPTPWDGSDADLPAGWDEGFLRAFESGREPDVLCALAISVRPDRQGQGLAVRMLEEMRAAARAGGLRELIAPVRPTLKARYPLIPIERYADWRREDGEHFDPWIRVHERIGGEILAVAPESMVMDCPVPDWEEWTGMRFPGDGDYVVPEMLAPLYVRDGRGRHVEPNVWLRHRL